VGKLKEKARCAVFGVGRLGFVHARNLAKRIPDATVAKVDEIWNNMEE